MAETRLNRLLNLILETAVDALAFDAATASLRHAQSITTMAATDQRYLTLDEAQYSVGEGPCVTVLDSHDPVIWTNAEADRRWPVFRDAADQAGIVTSLSMHVPLERTAGLNASLNLYARSRLEITDWHIRAAGSFADQIAATIASIDAHQATARLAAGLSEAMRTRAVIEQAKGILAAERRITPEEAFTLLVEQSQAANFKLRDIAVRLVEERTGRPTVHQE